MATPTTPPSELPTWATTLANRSKPSAGAISAGFQYAQRPPPKWWNWTIGMLCDWMGWFKVNTAQIERRSFSANETWVKPAGASWVEILLVGGGAGGAGGLSNTGGKGGESGEWVSARFRASDLPASLDVVIGAGGAGGNNAGGATYVTDGSTVRAFAAGGAGFTGNGTPPGISYDEVSGSYNGAPGGAGGAGAAGQKGNRLRASNGGAGGAGGAPNAPGNAGTGYGAGGGGGRQSSGTNAGGGGGGGGYLTNALASNGSGANGGAGAPGFCLIVSYIDNSLL